jgi:glutathionylspermidine synthase
MRRIPQTIRPDWISKAESVGFDWHTLNGVPYWDETAAYAFSLKQIEQDIEDPANQLEQMCLDFVAQAVVSEEILTSLKIPRAFWQLIYDSWMQGQRNLYGRFDFAYDGKNPAKLLEYNADTPTALYESAVFQWLWLEEKLKIGALPDGADQFNSLHERLIAAFKNLQQGKPYRLHLACAEDSAEDLGTITYLQDCARQAGLETRTLFMHEIGLDSKKRFLDLENRTIDVLFKLYPWEWMFEEDFGTAIPASNCTFIEPPWKMILSNKGLMVHLWRLHEGHPNLLPSFFADDARAESLKNHHVVKPLLSREGANVTLVKEGRTFEKGEGPYGKEGTIIQQAVELPDFDGHHPVIGAWLVASEACGLGIREDTRLITGNTSRFIPHFITG